LLRIYNTLAKRIEEIQPTTPGVIQMYTCGPTVYRDAHIGNLRTYLMADWVRRSLIHSGMQVTHIKNITDVGHMRQELAETGGDKMIMAALAEGKTIQEIAEVYAGRRRPVLPGRSPLEHHGSNRVPVGQPTHPRDDCHQ